MMKFLTPVRMIRCNGGHLIRKKSGCKAAFFCGFVDVNGKKSAASDRIAGYCFMIVFHIETVRIENETLCIGYRVVWGSLFCSVGQSGASVLSIRSEHVVVHVLARSLCM